MNTRSRFFLAALVVAAICLTALQPWAALSGLSQADWVGIGCLAAIGVLADLRLIQFSIGTTAASASINFIAQFATAILFPAPAAVLATIATVSFGQAFIHKRGF